MRVNLNNVKEGGFLEPGVYNCFITDVIDRTINEKDAVDIVFKDSISGAICKDTFFLTEKAAWKIKGLAIAAGITEVEFAEFDTRDLQGKPIVIKVIKENNPKDGKSYSKVQSFSPWKNHDSIPQPEKIPEKQINDDSWIPHKDDPF